MPRPSPARLTGVVAILLVVGVLSGPAARAEQSGSASLRIAATSLAVGNAHTCVLDETGSVRCWGDGIHGTLGYGNTIRIGDDETASAAGAVGVGGPVSAIAAGGVHTCALLVAGSVRCWGYAKDGQLGYGDQNNIGDNESPASAGNVPLFGKVTAIAVGNAHTCALFSTGGVRCWGQGESGKLGYGNQDNIGDNETPYVLPDIVLGGRATAITAGGSHTCALLTTGAVRCWGYGGDGRLGYGNATTIGDNETPASAGDVPLGGTAAAISAGASHTCALLTTGAVRCWGDGSGGRLGYAGTASIGDDETPAAVGDVPVGAKVTSVSAGFQHTCAVLTTGGLRCWGAGGRGRLGYGNTNDIGDDETPASASDVAVGRQAAAVEAGVLHTCALLVPGTVRCWGEGGTGYLGYGNTNDIGDDEVAGRPGDVPVGADLRVVAATRTELRVSPGRDRRAPYVFRAKGSVLPVGAAADAAVCSGTVRLLAMTGRLEDRRRELAKKVIDLRPDCSFDGRLKVTSGQVGTRHRRITVAAGFEGSANLSESVASVRVAVGRDRSRAHLASATPRATSEPPSAPRSLASTRTRAAVRATWRQPSDDGGAAVEGYRVRFVQHGRAVFLTSVGADTRRVTIPRSQLPAGRLTVRVRAANAARPGPAATGRVLTSSTGRKS